MLFLRWVREKLLARSPHELFADGEPAIGSSESLIAYARMDMVTQTGPQPGILLLTSERIVYRLIDASASAGDSIIVEALKNIRLGTPAHGPLNQFFIVLRREGAEMPLHLRSPKPQAPDPAVEVMYKQLQQLVP